jgi:hypothetical protein
MIDSWSDSLKGGRKMKSAVMVLAFVLVAGLSSVALAMDIYDSPYYRSDGAYIQGYQRTAPDNNLWKNYGAGGNINRYGGERGYRESDRYYAPQPSPTPTYNYPPRERPYEPWWKR